MSGMKTATERRGIRNLKNLLEDTDRILAQFYESDKRVVWDGEIELYPSKHDLETKNIVGKIPVQIKTLTKRNSNKDSITENVNYRDLVSYRNNGGCMYFVIYIGDNLKASIYYNALLPGDINSILSQKDDMSNRKVGFRSFPHNAETIIAVLRYFLDNRKKQTSDENCVYYHDVENKEFLKHLESFEFTLQGTNDDPFASVFDVPTVFYAKTTYGARFLYNKMNIDQFTVGFTRSDVYFNEKKYYDGVNITKTKDSEIITVGKGCTFNKSGRFDYKPIGTLDEQLIDAEFFVDLCTNPNKEVRVGDFAAFTVNEGIDESVIAEWSKYLSNLRRTRKALNQFGAMQDLDIDNLDENDYQQLNVLIAASEGARYKDSPVSPESALCRIKIGNLNITVLVVKQDEEYAIINTFDFDDSDVKISTKDGIENEASIYILFTGENLVSLANVNYDVMAKTITSKEYAPLYVDRVIHFLLDILNTYDKTKDKGLLNLSMNIAEWLVSNESNATNIINRLQAIKRVRDFTAEEVQTLMQLKSDYDTTDVATASCILLGSYLEAEQYWAKMDENTQQAFVKYPIFTLWTMNHPDAEKYNEVNP